MLVRNKNKSIITDALYYMSIRNLLYGNPTKRIIMRFVEIAVLGALSALVLAPEFGQYLGTAFGTALGATVLKFLRDLTQKE